MDVLPLQLKAVSPEGGVKILAVKILFVYTDFMAQATRKKNRRIVLAEFESFQLCL